MFRSVLYDSEIGIFISHYVCNTLMFHRAHNTSYTKSDTLIMQLSIFQIFSITILFHLRKCLPLSACVSICKCFKNHRKKTHISVFAERRLSAIFQWLKCAEWQAPFSDDSVYFHCRFSRLSITISNSLFLEIKILIICH